jgi:hypothetical protein
MYFPSGFDLATARLCAQLTAYAYEMFRQWKAEGRPRKESGFCWHPPSGTGLTFSSPIWSTVRTLFITNDSEPFGFVARDAAGSGYLVFRGTETAHNWFIDFDADQEPYEFVEGYGKVHDGFLKLYRSLRDDALVSFTEVGAIDSLWVTGHSLGCGLSTLAIPDVMVRHTFQRVEHYSFASPRVGHTTFTDRYNDNGVVTYRVVNTCDLVPQLPSPVLERLAYKHIGIPVNFTAQYGHIGANHSLTGAYRYALDNPHQPENMVPIAA